MTGKTVLFVTRRRIEYRSQRMTYDSADVTAFVSPFGGVNSGKYVARDCLSIRGANFRSGDWSSVFYSGGIDNRGYQRQCVSLTGYFIEIDLAVFQQIHRKIDARKFYASFLN